MGLMGLMDGWGNELRMGDTLLSLNEINQNVIPLTIGNDNTDAILRHLARCSIFRMHTTPAKSAFLCLDILTEIGTRLYPTNQLGGGIIRLSRIDAVNIRQQDKGVGIHHLRNQS